MKTSRKFQYAVVAMAIIFIVACTSDPFETPESNIRTNIIENPDYEIIRSMGFQTKGIIEQDDCYIVEGDIEIMKDSMELYLPLTRQAAYHGLIDSDEVDRIRVKIASSNIPDADWRRAVRAAIDAWNAVPNCRVWFHKIDHTILYHDVMVDMNPNLGNAIATGAIPQNGHPGKRIRINPAYNSEYSLEEKTYVMVHELGHILGLVHTDYVANYHSNPKEHSYDDPSKIDQILGTPLTENESVMDSHSGGRDWGEWEWDAWGTPISYNFTTGDLAAIQAMYGTPIWSGEIVGPSVCLMRFPSTYTLELGTNLINPNIKWYVNDELQQEGPSFSFTPTGLRQTKTTLKAVAEYGGGANYTTTKDISVRYIPIVGADNVRAYYSTTYDSPNLPEGWSFAGWSVAGGDYITTSELTETSLDIVFTGVGEYTVFANFAIPDGNILTAQKIVNVRFVADISGPDGAAVNNTSSYSISSTIPTGVTFTGWTVSGGEYTTTGGLADIALNINFSETAEYTLAANFLLPDGTSYARQKTVDVKSLTITGSDLAIINTASVYNIPTLPSGITFNGWNISPNSGYVASGTTGDTLDIRFISTGIYTISAYFTLPDGIPCSVSKTISAKKRLKIVKGTGVRKLNSAIIRGYGAGSKGLYFTDTGIREEFLASDNGTHSFYYLPREYIQMIADVVLSYPYYTDSSELRYGLATPEIEYLDIY